MADRTMDQRARIEALLRLPLTDPDADPLAVHRRLLFCARKGLGDPAALSELEMKQVCYALIVHYKQMDIE